ncbi:MAG: TraR/DksA family transcriptional regulator [Cohaesibacteraceae bacterium]
MIDLQLDLDRARKRLRARLAELDHRLVEIEHDLDEARPADFEEAASDRISDEMLEELGQVGLAEVRMIEAALSRIKAGTYGVCARCGDAVSAERLEAVPHAPLCRYCAGAGPQ